MFTPKESERPISVEVGELSQEQFKALVFCDYCISSDAELYRFLIDRKDLDNEVFPDDCLQDLVTGLVEDSDGVTTVVCLFNDGRFRDAKCVLEIEGFDLYDYEMYTPVHSLNWNV